MGMWANLEEHSKNMALSLWRGWQRPFPANIWGFSSSARCGLGLVHVKCSTNSADKTGWPICLIWAPSRWSLNSISLCLILLISTSPYWHTAPRFLVAVSVTESQPNWFILLPPDICEAFQEKKNKQKKNPDKLHNSKCFSFHILPTLKTLPLSNISLFNPFLKYPFTIENFATVWEWAELFAVLMERN